MEVQVSDYYLEIKKKKKQPPNNLHFKWGNGLCILLPPYS